MQYDFKQDLNTQPSNNLTPEFLRIASLVQYYY